MIAGDMAHSISHQHFLILLIKLIISSVNSIIVFALKLKLLLSLTVSVILRQIVFVVVVKL